MTGLAKSGLLVLLFSSSMTMAETVYKCLQDNEVTELKGETCSEEMFVAEQNISGPEENATCFEELYALSAKTLKELDSVKAKNETRAALLIQEKISGLSESEKVLKEAMYELLLNDMRELHRDFVGAVVGMPKMIEAKYKESALKSFSCDLHGIDMTPLVEKCNHAWDVLLEEIANN